MKHAFLSLALVVGTGIAFLAPMPGSGQDSGKGGFGRGGGKGAPQPPAGPMPRLPDGHPDMQGFWTPPAITDIEPAPGRGGRGGGGAAKGPDPATGFGGGGTRIVDPSDGKIPYKPEALQIKKENAEHWIDRDPELKCYLPGIPRAMYLPYPFQITQSTNKIHIAYEFSNSARTIHLDKVAPPPDDTWMGHSVGRWDGDTLVVDVSNFNDRAWFDRAGDFHSDALHLTERFSLMSPDVIQYDVTIEDPKVFTRPWRIAMPLYRRVEPNMQLLEFRCNEFVEEFMYGNLRKQPLVKHWEGDTMTIDITRKVPPGDAFYQWYGR